MTDDSIEFYWLIGTAKKGRQSVIITNQWQNESLDKICVDYSVFFLNIFLRKILNMDGSLIEKEKSFAFMGGSKYGSESVWSYCSTFNANNLLSVYHWLIVLIRFAFKIKPHRLVSLSTSPAACSLLLSCCSRSQSLASVRCASRFSSPFSILPVVPRSNWADEVRKWSCRLVCLFCKSVWSEKHSG